MRAGPAGLLLPGKGVLDFLRTREEPVNCYHAVTLNLGSRGDQELTSFLVPLITEMPSITANRVSLPGSSANSIPIPLVPPKAVTRVLHKDGGSVSHLHLH